MSKFRPFTVTISIESEEDVARLAQLLAVLNGDASTDDDDDEDDAPKKTKKPKKAKKAASGKKAKKTRAKKPKKVEEDDEDEDLFEDEDEDEATSLEDVREAINESTETHGAKWTRSVISGFKKKGGGNAKKLSDLKPKDYDAVIAALEEGPDE